MREFFPDDICALSTCLFLYMVSGEMWTTNGVLSGTFTSHFVDCNAFVLFSFDASLEIIRCVRRHR